MKVSQEIKALGFVAPAKGDKDCLGLPKLIKGNNNTSFEKKLQAMKIAFIFDKMRDEFLDLSIDQISDLIGYHQVSLYRWRNRFVLNKR